MDLSSVFTIPVLLKEILKSGLHGPIIILQAAIRRQNKVANGSVTVLLQPPIFAEAVSISGYSPSQYF